MRYRLRRLEFSPTLVALSGVALMFGLGIWQLQRLEWKNALIAQIEEGNRSAPLTQLPQTGFPALEHRKVRLKGKFLGKELQITPRYHDSALGYDLVQPFQLAQGETVLVDRGWVPADKKELETRSETTPPVERVTVEGLLRDVGRHNWATPDNMPEKNLWFWVDIPAMEKAEGITLLPVVIHQTNALGTAMLPVPNDEKIILRNDHLGYAITWFLVALSGLAVFIIYHLEKRETT